MTTLQPIEHVYIHSSDQTVVTNIKGEADISHFETSKVIRINHPSFETLLTSYEDLAKKGFGVQLVPSVLELNQVVISANSWEQNKQEVPSKILTITANDIKFANPQTSADLLGISNEVYIQKSQLGGGSPMIRGFSANRILTVIDGVRMNNAIYRSGNLQNIISIDANSIANSEVVFGPGSVIYGSDALGGVIDFHTLKPALSTTEKTLFTTNLLSRYSSANSEKTAHADFNLGGSKWGFLSSITYSDFNDLKMGSKGNEEYVRPEYVDRINGYDSIVTNKNQNIQKFSGYNQLNLIQKVRFSIHNSLDVQYGFHYSKLSNVPRYDRLLEYEDNRLKNAAWYYGPQKWVMNVVNVRYTNARKLFDQAKLTVAYQNYQESRHDRKLHANEIRERSEKVKAFSTNLNFEKQLNSQSILFYGLEAVLNKVNSHGQERNIATGELTPYASRYPDNSKYSSYAGYLSYKNNLSQKVTFSTGVRYNQVILNALFDTTFYPFPFRSIDINTGAFNGALGVVFRPTEEWNFNVNASTGFRAPNVDDVGKVFDSEPGSVVVPNPDLNPEYVYNLDLGIVKRIDNQFKIEVTGFYSLLKQAMVRRDFQFNGQDSIWYDGELSKVQALVNSDEATIYGFHVGVDGEILTYLSIKSSLTYTKGKDKEGMPLRHVAPIFGSTHVIFMSERIRADCYLNYNGEIANSQLAPSEQDKSYMYATDSHGNPYAPRWMTLNFKSAYQVNKVVQVTLGVENILDHRYRPYSSGIAAPGRNFILGLRVHY